jgi:hypothetical protein
LKKKGAILAVISALLISVVGIALLLTDSPPVVTLGFLGYSTNSSGTKLAHLCLTNRLDQSIEYLGGITNGAKVAWISVRQVNPPPGYAFANFPQNPTTDRYNLLPHEALIFAAPVPTNTLKSCDAVVWYLTAKPTDAEILRNNYYQLTGNMPKGSRNSSAAEATLP